MRGLFWVSYATGVALVVVHLFGLDLASGALGAAVSGLFVEAINRGLEAFRRPAAALVLLRRVVGHLEAEARDGDGIREEAWEDYQAAKRLLRAGRSGFHRLQ